MPIYAYKYRLPDSDAIHAARSGRCLEQPEGAGFLISAFLPHSPKIFIPRDAECESDTFRKALDENFSGQAYPFPERSTSPEEHAEEIKAIIRMEKMGDLRKCVAARCLVLDGGIDIDSLFADLCHIYKEAFVFCFSTPETGTWIGASPELLLKETDGELHTMALAGTRPTGSAGHWDAKNIGEHEVVVDFIERAFGLAGLAARKHPRFTQQAGPVEHLCTPIDAQAPYTTSILPLLDALSPTPALCGDPRVAAAALIADKENFPRAYYAGYCGPWHSSEEFSLYVTLRCARVAPCRYALFAGGGIMPDSDPASEWKETEQKLSTLLEIINTKHQ